MNKLENFFYDQNHKRGRPTNNEREIALGIASILKEGDMVYYDEINGITRRRCAGCITKLESVYAWINNKKYRIDKHNVFPASI